MDNKNDITLIWFLDNQRQLDFFQVSIKAAWKYNRENVNYIVYVPCKSLKQDIKLSIGVDIPILIIDDEKYLTVFKNSEIKNNMMILSVISPFLSMSKYTIFLDNDIISNVDYNSLIEIAEKKFNLENSTLIRRSWDLTKENLSYKFARKFYSVPFEEYKKSNGNGGVVIYNTLKYKNVFNNNIEKILDEISIFIKNMKVFNTDYRNMNPSKEMFLDDEWFLNIHTWHDSPAVLPRRFNFSLNWGLKELIETFQKEGTITIHLADNPAGIKDYIYKLIFKNGIDSDDNSFLDKKLEKDLISIINNIVK